MKKSSLLEGQSKAGIVLQKKVSKNAEQKINESELKYRFLVENSLIGVFRTKVNGDVEYVNDSILRMLEFDNKEELLNIGASMRYKEPKQREELLKILKENGKVEGYEANIITKKGNEHIFLMNIVINGEILDGTLIDITERKKAEEALHESEVRFRIAAETSNDIVYEWDLKEEVKWFGKIDEMLGYAPGEFPRTLEGLGASVYPEDWVRVMAAVQAHLEGRAPYAEDYRVLMKDGTFRWWSARGAVARMPDGKPVRWIGTVTDITDRRKMEEALHESKARYDIAMQFSKDGLYDWNLITNEIYYSPGWKKMVGYEDEELVNDFSVWELLTEPEDVKNTMKMVNELIEKKRDRFEMDFKMKHKQGHWVNILSRANALFDEHGKAIRIIGTHVDITERKQAEESLRINEERLKETQRIAKLGSLDWNLIKNDLVLSEETLNIYGFGKEKKPTLEEITGLLYPDDRDKVEKSLSNAAAGIAKHDMEHRMVRPDGKIIYVNATAELFRDHDGNPVRLLGTVLDITERKLAEEIIKNNEKRFRELIESLPQLFWTCRVDGPCDYLSRQWVEYTGVPEAEQLGYRWLEQLHPDDKDRTVSEWMEKVKTGESFDIEFRIRRNDAIYHWFKTRAVPMRDSDENIIKWFGSNTDFDGIKKAEEQLINFSKELERKVEERTKELEAFSYSVSHDLRAPLRHVSGYVELLNKHFHNELSEKGQHYLSSISDSVHLMGKLIDDLLRFSRTGRVEMVRSVVDMNVISREVKDSLSKDNPNRNIKWILGNLPSVYGDGSMLNLVWENLLNNAVKFTGARSDARIEIGVKEEKKEWVFYVKDNGVGFDMQYAHKLFGVFQRLHPTEEYEGTGIGLANVRRIVSRHGGRTWAEAEPDKGAIFNFSIPKNKEDS